MTTVKELVESLQKYSQDAEVIIAESQYEWYNVLVIMENPETPDDNPELHI